MLDIAPTIDKSIQIGITILKDSLYPNKPEIPKIKNIDKKGIRINVRVTISDFFIFFGIGTSTARCPPE